MKLILYVFLCCVFTLNAQIDKTYRECVKVFGKSISNSVDSEGYQGFEFKTDPYRTFATFANNRCICYLVFADEKTYENKKYAFYYYAELAKSIKFPNQDLVVDFERNEQKSYVKWQALL